MDAPAVRLYAWRMRSFLALLLVLATPAFAADPRADALALHAEIVALAPLLAPFAAPPKDAAATAVPPADQADQITIDIIMPLQAATQSYSDQVTINGEEGYKPYADCLTVGEALAARANALAFALRGMAPATPDDPAPYETALGACETALGGVSPTP